MADFQRHKRELEDMGGRIAAVSSDPQADAEWTARELGLEFTLGYGLDAEAAALTIGCYTGTREGCAHVQPSGFILDPDGTIVHAVYSSGKVGRLTAADALTILKGRQEVPVPGAQ